MTTTKILFGVNFNVDRFVFFYSTFRDVLRLTADLDVFEYYNFPATQVRKIKHLVVYSGQPGMGVLLQEMRPLLCDGIFEEVAIILETASSTTDGSQAHISSFDEIFSQVPNAAGLAIKFDLRFESLIPFYDKGALYRECGAFRDKTSAI